MNTFGTLYRYEWKKLLQKKTVWIAAAVGILVTVLVALSDFFSYTYLDGLFIGSHYQMTMLDQAYAKELSGLPIDGILLGETVENYRNIPDAAERKNMDEEEYLRYARSYSQIFQFIRLTTRLEAMDIIYQWQPDEQDLYARQQELLEHDLESLHLSEGEKAFWKEQEAAIEKPYIYQSHDAYDKQFTMYQSVGVTVLILITFCLAGVFPDEHSRRTDQLALCSVEGRKNLYWAKILAGISFSAGVSAFFSLLTAAMNLLLYGTDGFTASFQFIYCFFAPMSCGRALLIAHGVMLIASVLFAILILLLSELTRNSTATLGIGTALLMAGMAVSIPGQYRILAQIWQWLPFSCLVIPNIFSYYTLPLFGHYFTAWQAVPVIYAAAGCGIAAAGKAVYGKYQVTGR